MEAAVADEVVGGCRPLAALVDYLDSLDGRMDLGVMSGLLGDLDVSATDFGTASAFCPDSYQRNVLRRSSWYELVVLCWEPGQRTPIHDHRGSSCAFRVVEGVATETRFDPTPSGLYCAGPTERLGAGTVCAAEDDDVHQVANAEAAEPLVTLHIYSPPLDEYTVYSLDTPGVDGQAESVVLPTPAD